MKSRLHEEWKMEYMTLFMRDEEKRAEGYKNSRLDTIKKMLKNNYSIEAILNLDFSEEEIEKAKQIALKEE